MLPRFQNLSIRYKLLGGFLAIALLTSIFGYYFLVKVESLRDSISKASSGNDQFNLLLNLSFENGKMATSVRHFMMTRDPAAENDYNAAAAVFDSSIAELRASNMDGQQKSTVNQIASLSNQIRGIQLQVMSKIRNNETQQAQMLFNTIYYDQQTNLSSLIQDLVNNNDQQINAISESNAQAAQDLQVAVGSLLVLVIASTVSIALILSSILTRSITKLSKTADLISHGNLKVPAEVVSNDEIGKLAESFNRMSSRLQESYEKLEQRVEERTHQLAAANERLKELDRLKTEFISIGAHELRTPIQPIIGYAELAERGRVKPETAMKIIKESAVKLRNLANDILEASKIEGARLVLNRERFDINNFLSNIALEMQMKTHEGVELKLDLSSTVEIYADKMRLTQVITNLVTNAAKFTTAGTITIQTKINDSAKRILIRVVDTGRGIPKEIMPTLFAKFNTRSIGEGEENGTGLGLFISKGIIEAHGGTISGTNNDNGGAVFSIELPLENSASGLASTISQKPPTALGDTAA